MGREKVVQPRAEGSAAWQGWGPEFDSQYPAVPSQMPLTYYLVPEVLLSSNFTNSPKSQSKNRHPESSFQETSRCESAADSPGSGWLLWHQVATSVCRLWEAKWYEDQFRGSSVSFQSKLCSNGVNICTLRQWFSHVHHCGQLCEGEHKNSVGCLMINGGRRVEKVDVREEGGTTDWVPDLRNWTDAVSDEFRA